MVSSAEVEILWCLDAVLRWCWECCFLPGPSGSGPVSMCFSAKLSRSHPRSSHLLSVFQQPPPDPPAPPRLCVTGLCRRHGASVQSAWPPRALWAALPSLGSTGCFVSLGLRTREGCTRKFSVFAGDWWIAKKTRSQPQLSVSAGATGRCGPATAVRGACDENLPQKGFISVSKSSADQLCNICTGATLYHSLLFTGFY